MRAGDAWRATGADLPFGDPARPHGVALEGWYWRLADPAGGRVVAAMAGFAREAGGAAWANVVVAAHPEGIVRSTAVDAAAPADRWPSAGDALVSGGGELRAGVGDLQLRLRWRAGLPLRGRLWGGLGPAHLLPLMPQYWTPLAAGVGDAALVVGGRTHDLPGVRVYAEKNWGRSFPRLGWWWGVAHAFADPRVVVAFAGGPLAAVGSVRPSATALVVRTADGLLRLGTPGVSPVAVELAAGGLQLRGRGPGVRVRVLAERRESAVRLPHPEPPGRQVAERAEQELAGALSVTVERRRAGRWRVELDARSPLSGLERGEPA